MKNTEQEKGLILGLDVGANSIGWALVEAVSDKPSQPLALKSAGVRVFEAGVEGDIASGKDASRAAKRREARLHRRQLARHRHRMDKLASLLQQAALLPEDDLSSAGALMSFFQEMDRGLLQSPRWKAASDMESQNLPYRLRAKALDERLEPHELGRALYHLAQRRGFASNRKSLSRSAEHEKEEGKVKKGISELTGKMEASGARTLGEYFSGLNPHEERIRSRYTDRRMYQDEFERIWAAQASHYPSLLTDDLKKKVHRAIFFQRPLKSQKHLVGKCELEPQSRRAPLACLEAQRFRLLQKVNDLEINFKDGTKRRLTLEERNKLAEELESGGDLKFTKIRKLLSLKDSSFNLEESEEKLIGNRTAAKLIKVLGEKRWQNFSPQDKARIVEDLHSIQNKDALKRRATNAWDLDENQAAQFADTSLEDEYCSLSRKALKKLLPLMEQGTSFAAARKELYGDTPPPEAVDFLPSLAQTDIIEVRNPAVHRCLTELRKVVNAIIRAHGKPSIVRIELARDLKKTRKQREKIFKQYRENRSAREKAAEEILRQTGITQPRPSDKQKWLLAKECEWTCPYSGRTITVEALFGEHPQFDIEHIIPFHRSLNNSFANKTLCYHEENRQRKRNHTPYEAYGSNPQKWPEIITRVRNFTSNLRDDKLQRFQAGAPGGMTLEEVDEMASRLLNDTRYVSKLAVRYLGQLYGAGEQGTDLSGKKRIQASRGQITSELRNEWGLNAILGDGGEEKKRTDHRHHAIDAAVIALTDAAKVKMLSDAAARAQLEKRRRFAPIKPPWPTFYDDLRQAIQNLIVSHRVSRKVNAALHEETYYSKPRTHPDGKEYVHVRKPLAALKAPDIDDIVDGAVKQAVKSKLQELGTNDPGKVFKEPDNHPALHTKDDRQIPIHSARIRRRYSVESIGQGPRQRQVIFGSNHHMEILEVKDKKGQTRWDGVVVSTYEALRRLRAGQPIIQRDHGPDKKFLFSLAGGEIIEIDEENGEERALYVVKKITKRGEGESQRRTVGIVGTNDARESSTRELKEPSPEVLRRGHCKKVLITPLGEVRYAND
jgi:CRISPR-associated endonuclease Csn1